MSDDALDLGASKESILLMELFHALQIQSSALFETATHLLVDDVDVESKREVSVYRILDHKVDKGDYTFDELVRILSLLLREIDRYRVAIDNYINSGNRGEQLEPTSEQTDFFALLEEAAGLFRLAALRRRIDIRLNLNPNERPILKLDRTLIRRLFINLFDNAVKYSFDPPDERSRRYIDVNSWRYSAHGSWRTKIKSFGVGILPEELASGKIFEYGSRGDLASDRNRSGTGIGLSEARRIAIAHGGSIEVESLEQKGGGYVTVLTVTLPLGT